MSDGVPKVYICPNIKRLIRVYRSWFFGFQQLGQHIPPRVMLCFMSYNTSNLIDPDISFAGETPTLQRCVVDIVVETLSGC